MIRSVLIIIASFAIGLMLMIAPIPVEMSWGRPLWMGLLVIFWGIYAPNYVGLITAWLVGLLVDQLSGTILGVHALGLLLLAYLTSSFYNKLRLAHLPQQTVMIFFLLLVYQAWIALIQGMIGALPELTWIWCIAPATSALLWPFSLLLQRRIHLYYDTAR